MSAAGANAKADDEVDADGEDVIENSNRTKNDCKAHSNVKSHVEMIDRAKILKHATINQCRRKLPSTISPSQNEVHSQIRNAKILSRQYPFPLGVDSRRSSSTTIEAYNQNSFLENVVHLLIKNAKNIPRQL